MAGLQLERLEETGDKAKGTPGCPQERDDREVNHHPIHWELGDSGAGPWQGTEAERSAHSNDTLEGTLQPG